MCESRSSQQSTIIKMLLARKSFACNFVILCIFWLLMYFCYALIGFVLSRAKQIEEIGALQWQLLRKLCPASTKVWSIMISNYLYICSHAKLQNNVEGKQSNNIDMYRERVLWNSECFASDARSQSEYPYPNVLTSFSANF